MQRLDVGSTFNGILELDEMSLPERTIVHSEMECEHNRKVLFE